VEYFWFDINTLDHRTFRSAFSLLDRERKKRVRRMASTTDKQRTVMGEYLIRDVLSKKMNLNMKDIMIHRDEKEKPFVDNCPVQFSISHTDHYVVCVVDDYPVGIDIEEIKPVEEKFIKRVCDQEELRYIRYGFGGYTQRFWECWTAKEALFKLTGQGSLLSQSRCHLPEGVSLEHFTKENFSVTVARKNI